MKGFRFLNLLGVFLILVTLLGAGVQHASAGGGGVVYTVTSVNEGGDVNLSDGICDATSGPGVVCTLRAAIQQANHDVAANTIDFNLPGIGMHYISISSGPLPAIIHPLAIDGASQPNCVVPCIVLSGAVIGGSNNGLTLNTGASLIRGLSIVSFGGSGINVNLANSGVANYIQHNDIGFIPGEVTSHGNGQGIFVSLSAINTLIGGTTAAERNVISGNLGSGIVLDGGTTTVTGNFIGTNPAGTGAKGNGADGIALYADASNNKIGGTVAGSGNKIAFNSGAGIALNDSSVHPTRNNIRRNSIFSNGGLGIDLNSDGVTLNDNLDPDAGSNGLQNYPVLTAANHTTRVISGHLNSKPSKTYVLEFFSSPSCDASAHGEGKNYIGTFNVTTNSMGNISFSQVVAGTFAVNTQISATATDAAGNTSEFSTCRTSN